jgi:hypothetical protein
VAFAKPKASSTARGYGTAHMKARGELLARFTPGDPCCLCHRPMWTAKGLHADHIPGTDQYRGLAHPRCNIRDGARRGRARQTATRLRW